MSDLLIEFEMKKNGKGRISVDGNVPELLAGVLVMIKDIYQSILLNGDEKDAEWFLQQIGNAMVCPDHNLYEEVR